MSHREGLETQKAILEDDIVHLKRTLADKEARLRSIQVRLSDPDLPPKPGGRT